MTSIPFNHPVELEAPQQYDSIYALPKSVKQLKLESMPLSRFQRRIDYENGIRPVLAQQLALEIDMAGHGQTSKLTATQRQLLGYNTFIADSFFSRARVERATLEDRLREEANE